MNFRYKDKSFNENTPNDPKNLIFKKKIKFVCFPSFYDPKNKNWSILVRFLQNRKFLGNRQTIKKLIYTERKQTNFSLINIHYLNSTQIEQKLWHFKLVT